MEATSGRKNASPAKLRNACCVGMSFHIALRILTKERSKACDRVTAAHGILQVEALWQSTIQSPSLPTPSLAAAHSSSSLILVAMVSIKNLAQSKLATGLFLRASLAVCATQLEMNLRVFRIELDGDL